MKTKLVLSTLAAAVALPLFALPAFADRDDDDGDRYGRYGAKMLSRVDTNDDGKVSKDEFLGRRLEVFQRMDTNGDGQLSREEAAAGMPAQGTAAPEDMRAMHQAMMDRRFRGLDTDGSGTVSADEFTQMPGLKFAMMDADDDGTITADEMRGGKGWHGMGMMMGGMMMGGHHGKGGHGGWDRD